MSKRFDAMQAGQTLARHSSGASHSSRVTKTHEESFCSRESEPTLAVVYLLVGAGLVLACLMARWLL